MSNEPTKEDIINRRKAKAEDLKILLDKGETLTLVEIEYISKLREYRIEQWFLEALDEIKYLKIENATLKLQCLSANKFHEQVEKACQDFYKKD